MARHAGFLKLAGALLCLAALYLVSNAHAQGVKSDSEVKISATATKPDASGKQIVTVTMVHNPDWHTYANPVDNEDFASNKTVVNIKAKAKPASIKIDYPMGVFN